YDLSFVALTVSLFVTATSSPVFSSLSLHDALPILRTLLTLVAGAVTYLAVQNAIDPMSALIESEAGWIGGLGLPVWFGWLVGGRSEEHTSELQSRENLVCRLLLEKKKD